MRPALQKTVRILAFACLGLAPGLAWPQVGPVQQGNVLDANPMVGGGGTNQPIPGYVPINGNQIINGNVAGLGYFHGNIPYSSQYDFHGSLGGASFNNFVRQSAGSPSGGATYTGQLQSFYQPTRVVTTDNGRFGPPMTPPGGNGFEASMQGPNNLNPASSGRTAQPLGQRLELVPAGAPPRPFGTVDQDPGYGGSYQPNSLFGMRSPLDSSVYIRPIQATPTPLITPTTLPGTQTPAIRTDNGVGTEIKGAADDGHVRGRVDASLTAQPVSPLVGQTNLTTAALPGDVYQDLLVQLRKTQEKAAAEAKLTGKEPTTQPDTAGKMVIDPVTGQLTMVLPKGDTRGKPPTFQSDDPSRPNYRPTGGTSRTLPPLTAEQSAALQAGRDLKPLTTFVGPAPSNFNTVITRAEAELKAGKYLDASNTFQQAVDLQPTNALAIVGRAHAQLAAGMYESAAYDLKTLFAQKAELASVRYDLGALITPQRVTFVIKDLGTLSGHSDSDAPTFLLAYVDYQDGKTQDLDKLLTDWSKRQTRNRWPAILRRAWLEPAH